MDNRKLKIISHRAGGKEFPESTIEGIEYSIASGCAVIDVDIRLTSDKRLVVFHTNNLELTTDQVGLVEDKTYAELSQADAGFRFSLDKGTTFPYRGRGITIPLLADALSRFPEIEFYIHLHEDVALDTGKELVKLLSETGNLGRVSVFGGSEDVTRPVKEISGGKIRRGASARETFAVLVRQLCRLEIGKIDFDYFTPGAQDDRIKETLLKLLFRRKSLIDYLHRSNVPVFIWTINDDKEYDTWASVGVDGAWTDYPKKIMKHINGDS